jgi:hypothetical protein
VGGRIPLPTLAEKKWGVVAADVLLEKFMLVRYDCEDGFREWPADVAAGLTGAWDFGAGRIDLAGSAARSINVFLFGAGSGTIAREYHRSSVQLHTNSSIPAVCDLLW